MYIYIYINGSYILSAYFVLLQSDMSKHAHTKPDKHTHTYTHRHTHTQTPTHTHAHGHAHTHTHTHIHTQTNTNTHQHTNTHTEMDKPLTISEIFQICLQSKSILFYTTFQFELCYDMSSCNEMSPVAPRAPAVAHISYICTLTN